MGVHKKNSIAGHTYPNAVYRNPQICTEFCIPKCSLPVNFACLVLMLDEESTIRWPDGRFLI
jgi:hypothetical protein